MRFGPQLREEALQRYRDGIARGIGEIRGYDADPKVLRAAASNIRSAGLDEFVKITLKPINEWVKPTHADLTAGYIVTNPPYGERLGEVQQLKPFVSFTR